MLTESLSPRIVFVSLNFKNSAGITIYRIESDLNIRSLKVAYVSML